MDNLPITTDTSKFVCQKCFWKTCTLGGHYDIPKGKEMARSGGTTRGEDRKPGRGGR